MITNEMLGVVFVVASLSFLSGFYVERWRRRVTSRAWRARRGQRPKGRGLPFHRGRRPAPPDTQPATDAFEQLRAVTSAEFEKRRLMSKAEAKVFYAAEDAVRAQRLSWRVMAQVNLGEILWTADKRAFSAINSKRVDVLLISRHGEPIVAIEYQGEGHYQGTASARDASKREALRRAGVHFIEMTPKHGAEDLAREIARIARDILPPSAPTGGPAPTPSRP